MTSYILIFVLIFICCSPAFAKDGAIIFKYGTLSVSETQRTVRDEITTYEEDSIGEYGIELEGQMTKIFTYGYEYLTYRNKYTRAGDNGTAKVKLLSLNLKFKFDTPTIIRPYLGFGLAGAEVRMDTPGVMGNEYNFAYQFMGGMEFRFSKRLGLYTEYKKIGFANTHGINDRRDISTSGLFIGLSLYID